MTSLSIPLQILCSQQWKMKAEFAQIFNDSCLAWISAKQQLNTDYLFHTFDSSLIKNMHWSSLLSWRLERPFGDVSCRLVHHQANPGTQRLVSTQCQALQDKTWHYHVISSLYESAPTNPISFILPWKADKIGWWWQLWVTEELLELP